MTDATLTAAAGEGTAAISDRTILGIPRSLYLYENVGVEPQAVAARSLSLFENVGVEPQSVTARGLYLFENVGVEPQSIAARSLYLFESTRDGEVFPYLNHISPTEQYEGGQVDLYGDGFGGILEAAAGATITVDSVNGGYVAGNAIDGTESSWISNAQLQNAWIRFTFGATKRIVGIALEAGGNGWGVPRFLFSSGGEVSGVLAVPGNAPAGSEYPLGAARLVYTLPTPRDTTYVEIRGPAGNTTGFVGFAAAWIYEEVVPADGAEASRAWLNLDLPTEQDMGIVAWQNRSPNLHPANSGVPLLPAATVTIPSGAVSGLVTVQEEV